MSKENRVKTTKVKTLQDVRDFFKELNAVIVNFDPDDDIGDYIAFKDDTPSFPKEEAIRLNTLLDDCFAICEEKGVDIYELANQIITK